MTPDTMIRKDWDDYLTGDDDLTGMIWLEWFDWDDLTGMIWLDLFYYVPVEAKIE